ncbi:MAG: prepilin-type N-terminal cleavage/methylation domain-containing protein [Archangium sp.]|nr:prepilin-type N-terminal cleavage/methylation domain-containing protein [Archangium sp.]
MSRAPRQTAPRGLTLIELTVALAIVVVMFAAVVFGVGAFTGARAKEASTELAGVIRNLYDTAALTGKTCRLVFEIPGPRDEDGVTTWRAECAKSGVTAAAKRDDELKAATDAKRKGKDKLADDKRFRRMDSDDAPSLQELQEREKNRVDDASKFTDFESEEIAQRQLPSNVAIEVWTAKQREKVTSGVAYMYFFPQGFTERSQVWVAQGSNVWTLTVSPLTGKTVIHGERLEVPRS